MPRATVSTEAQRFDLKTCPDGYVTLKPLSFGQMLYRRDESTKITMMQEATRNRRGRRNVAQQDEPSKIEFEMAQEWTRWYEFHTCIVEHNLEDETGAKLDFSNKLAITKLDPRIGQEIERLIDDLNQEEEEEFEEADFISPSSTSVGDSDAPTLVGGSAAKK